MPDPHPDPDDLDALAAELAAIPNLDDPLPTQVWWRERAGAQREAPPAARAAPAPAPAPAPVPQRPAPPQTRVLGVPAAAPAGPPVTAGVPGPVPPVAADAAVRPVAPQQTSLPQQGNPPAPPGRRRRRRWGRVVLGVVAVLVIFVLLAALAGWQRYRGIERITVAGLAPGGPFTNYLIVGSDSRDGIDPNNPNAGAILGDGTVSGQRTDTLMVLQLRPDRALLLSVPRDLLLPIAGAGYEDRVNAAYSVGGPDALVQTISEGLALPIHHYAEVDLAGFLGVVEATGGVTIPFDAPARDQNSGLYVERAGDVRLDENQALAYVRSRYYERLVDGEWVPEVQGDLDRVVRQQTFLRAVAAEISATRNPAALNGIAGALGDAVAVDDGLSLRDSVRLALRLRDFNPTPVPLPVYPTTTDDGASVLVLAEGADAALSQFRG
jgi:LCP family protein required for cell wall assembly